MVLNRRPGPVTRVRVSEWRDDRPTEREDQITTEEPMEIRIGEPGTKAARFGVTMRTPGNDFELAAGLLYTEGIVGSVDEIESIAYCTDALLSPSQRFNVVTVRLTSPARTTWSARQMTATSACGVCGADSVDDVAELASIATYPGDHSRWPAQLLAALPDALRSRQQIFDRTGGLHAAGVFDRGGDLVSVREDVGRHNAVDKVIGHLLLSRADAPGSALCTTGRLGFEIVQKAVMAQYSAIVAVGAPTSLAVSLAERAGTTITGFTGPDRMVVYAGRLSAATTTPVSHA